jgi:hypothetical protein
VDGGQQAGDGGFSRRRGDLEGLGSGGCGVRDSSSHEGGPAGAASPAIRRARPHRWQDYRWSSIRVPDRRWKRRPWRVGSLAVGSAGTRPHRGAGMWPCHGASVCAGCAGRGGASVTARGGEERCASGAGKGGAGGTTWRGEVRVAGKEKSRTKHFLTSGSGE